MKRRFKIPNTWNGIINWTSLKWEVESIQGRHENGTEEETLIAASFWLYSAGLSKNVDGEIIAVRMWRYWFPTFVREREEQALYKADS